MFAGHDVKHLCFSFQKESVALALKILDDYEIRGYRLHVESAKFQLKGEYDASKKKKKAKDYKKKLSQQQKYAESCVWLQLFGTYSNTNLYTFFICALELCRGPQIILQIMTDC